MNDLMKLNLRRFDDEEAAEEEAEAVDVPDRPGVGGVLTVWAETVDDDTFLNCKWLEIREAIDKGWVVAVFDGEGHCTLATDAIVYDGDDPEYNVTVGSDTYSADAKDGQPMLFVPDDDNEGGGGAPK